MIKNSAAGDEQLRWHGEELVLLPQRALWWPARRMLLIADPHFGKAATFRAAAIPLPDGTAADLGLLTELIAHTQPETLTILGDLLHSRQGRCKTMFETVRAWRERHASLQIKLILGNHDLRAGRPPANWEMECVTEPETVGPFQLRHHPDFETNSPTLAGHLHPKFRLQSNADTVIAPGFLLRGNCLVLPAFSSFVDSQVIPRQPGDAWFVTAEGEICRMDVPVERVRL